MQFQDKPKKRVMINITSLIDVLFLLLIFFMVSSTFLEQPGMKLDLPEAKESDAVRSEGYTLFITADETLFLNEEPVTIENLLERLKKIAPEAEETGLILKADEDIRYGLVVEAMDLIRQSGIVKLVIATDIKETE
ncbi:biopolymer transporter ExbD [candidate division KSB1 bacterium]|nr:biopolymer transporter ExbD [candidate division KSB1 bacterium]